MSPQVEHRVRERDDPSQHGGGAGRRGVRPRQLRFFTGQRRACHIKLFGLANCCKNSGLLIGLGNCSASERELAEERNAGNTHYLGQVLLEAHLLRRLHPPLAGLVRVRLEARAHPAAAGAGQLGIGWSKLPGLHGGGDRGHRLRPPRPLRVHPGPDGRLARALGVAAGRGRHRATRCARASATSIRRGSDDGGRRKSCIPEPDARCRDRRLVGRSARPRPAGEWRSWCGDPDRTRARASLGWHFYCDRAEEPPEAEPAPPRRPRSRPRAIRDSERIEAMRKALEEARAEAILEPDAGEGDRLSAPAAGDPATGGRLLRRLPAHGLGDAGARLHAAPPGRRARQAGLVGRNGARPATPHWPGSGALRADLPGPCRLRGLQGVRAAAPRLRVPPRPRRAGGLAHRRGAGGLARGGRRQRARRPARPRQRPGPRAGAVRHRHRNGSCRSAFGVMAEDEMAERIFALTALEPGNDY